MKTINQLLNQPLVAKVKLHNYRYPKHNIKSGDYAIVVLDVVKVIEGEIPVEFETPRDSGHYRFIANGKMPKLNDDDEYLFSGTLKNDPDWGGQYSCISIHLDYNMDNPEDQKKFFSFFLSDRQIELLFQINDNPVALLENKDITALTSIKGIGAITANRMCMKYADNKNNGKAYIALKELDLTKHAIDKLIERFGSADVVVSLIKENPYSLIRLVRGYGWEKCDKIALRQGFTSDCKNRVIAYAQHYLQQHADINGNSCILIEELLTAILDRCPPIDQKTAASYIKEEMWGQQEFDEYYEQYLQQTKDLETPLFFYSKEDRKVGLFELRRVEKDIVRHIERIKTAPATVKFNHDICEKIINQVEEEQGFNYTEEQRKAMWSILNNNITVLTGSAGCGKTWTLKPLIRIFKHYGLDVQQCALSGRASSLLSEITDLNGKTIHRLLCYSPELEKFTKSETNPLNTDVVILDETSMVGEELFLDLIKAIPTGAKVILLGDVKQLPPLAVGNILNDCIHSGYVKTSTLTIIQRQAAQSGIVTQSLLACEGKQLVKSTFCGSEIRGKLNDFKITCSFDSTLIHNEILEEFKDLYYNKHILSDDIQVIVPVRVRGINSCLVLNKEIQAIVNGQEDPNAVTINYTDNGTPVEITFKTGDRIIVNHNNYHAVNLDGTETAIFNGNIGHITSIGEDYMVLKFVEQGNVILPKEEWWNINLAYAITCHKLQGSQAPYCIVGLDYSSYVLLSREWVYTALTRAKKHCTLICQPKAINYATKNSSIKVKQTWLKKELETKYLEECKKG